MKTMKTLMLITLMLVLTACGLIQSKDLCYEVGRATAYQYITSGGIGDEVFENMITQTWIGFDKAVTTYRGANIKPSQFADYAKQQIKDSGLPSAMKEKADGFVDACWVKLKANVNVSDEDGEKFFLDIQALRDGIKDGISMAIKK